MCCLSQKTVCVTKRSSTNFLTGINSCSGSSVRVTSNLDGATWFNDPRCYASSSNSVAAAILLTTTTHTFMAIFTTITKTINCEQQKDSTITWSAYLTWNQVWLNTCRSLQHAAPMRFAVSKNNDMLHLTNVSASLIAVFTSNWTLSHVLISATPLGISFPNRKTMSSFVFDSKEQFSCLHTSH